MHDTRGTCHDHPRVRTISPITMVAQPNLSSLFRLECRLCRRFRHVMLLTAVNHILQEQFVKLSLHACSCCHDAKHVVCCTAIYLMIHQ